MINFDQKYYGLSLSTWILIAIVFVYCCISIQCEKENFTETAEPIKVYNFNTTWCGYSVRFQPIWDEFHSEMSSQSDVITLDIKCDDLESNKEARELCEKYNVRGYPTVILDKGGKVMPFNKNRDLAGLKEAVEEARSL